MMAGFYADGPRQTMFLPPSWQPVADRLEPGALAALEKQIPRPCFPPQEHWLRAYELCALAHTKVVVIGQDPYHGPGQAEGLAFSVAAGAWPPSLNNIFKEMCDDLECQPPFTGSLVHWAEQGVLLLNRVLTVSPGHANSHQGLGWENLTQATIEQLASEPVPRVYWLWGKAAQSLAPLIPAHQLALEAPHPSPLSSYRGFFGSKPFSKTNAYLSANGLTPIRWSDA